jgi:hypothetical protein
LSSRPLTPVTRARNTGTSGGAVAPGSRCAAIVFSTAGTWSRWMSSMNMSGESAVIRVAN